MMLNITCQHLVSAGSHLLPSPYNHIVYLVKILLGFPVFLITYCMQLRIQYQYHLGIHTIQVLYKVLTFSRSIACNLGLLLEWQDQCTILTVLLEGRKGFVCTNNQWLFVTIVILIHGLLVKHRQKTICVSTSTRKLLFLFNC